MSSRRKRVHTTSKPAPYTRVDEKTIVWNNVPMLIDKLKHSSFPEEKQNEIIADFTTRWRALVLPKQPHREPVPFTFEFDTEDALLAYMTSVLDDVQKVLDEYEDKQSRKKESQV